ncbi:unnamed protein product [Chilo suppressalis]|uniref:Uncharacterized protein n=1 Tax=Chilo suppressalis TaxID=168631 RepID=A0ABN8B6P3_CHISP|nr:unnamed protein product [Chilo suppressalis]
MPSRIVKQAKRSKGGPEALPSAPEEQDVRTVTVTRDNIKKEMTMQEMLACRNELDDVAQELLADNQEERRRGKADALAKRMKEVVGEYVEICRPEKRADLKLTGLDESVTPKELKEAIAREGGCAESEISSGGEHPSPGGMRGILVRCPTWAARKLVEKGRLKGGLELSEGDSPQPARALFPVHGQRARGCAMPGAGGPEHSVLQVTRPMKLADIRVSGLDDTVTPEEVSAALAQKAGYPPETIRVGAISAGVRGIGSAIASCPVEAVGRLVKDGRLEEEAMPSRIVTKAKRGKSKRKRKAAPCNSEESQDSEADALAKRMEEVVGEYVEICRPEKKADLKLTGLDESVTLKEIKEEIAREGGCAESERKSHLGESTQVREG